MHSKYKLLLFALGVLLAMLTFRFVCSVTLAYFFLPWNTFLAVVPYLLSSYINDRNLSKTKNLFVSGFCILFLPNALYLISDFEHLVERPPVPFFFDILLMFYAAVLGLVLNILSLRNLQNITLRFVPAKLSNWIMGAIILLSGFGVYLGRYLRWNSWDIFTHPKGLVIDCALRVLYPHQHVYTWAVTLGYASVLGFGYFLFIKVKE